MGRDARCQSTGSSISACARPCGGGAVARQGVAAPDDEWLNCDSDSKPQGPYGVRAELWGETPDVANLEHTEETKGTSCQEREATQEGGPADNNISAGKCELGQRRADTNLHVTSGTHGADVYHPRPRSARDAECKREENQSRGQTSRKSHKNRSREDQGGGRGKSRRERGYSLHARTQINNRRK